MYDLNRIRTVLEGFRTLPTSRLSQSHGEVYEESMSGDIVDPECGACVGAWCAVFLDSEQYVDDNGELYWCFTEGAQDLGKLLSVVSTERLLLKHGAPSSPFGSSKWLRQPYLVLRDAVKDVTGYDHDEYLRSLVAPHEEIEEHRILEAMP